MALPVILFDSSTGSDSLASGAGPGTAITGSVGRTRNASGEVKFGFFGATDDFSGVATDGSAVAYVAIATAGQRNFSAMTAIKNTRQTGSDGAITSGTAILTVGSTTGWTANDLIKVTGAGAGGADFYERVTSVDSPTQATLNGNASTTVGPSATWENPKQATFGSGQGVNTGTTDTAWAIGGKRLTLASTSSRKLWLNNSGNGDAMPGWTLEMSSGYTETIAASLLTWRSGDATTGAIVVRGASSSSPPVLTFSNNGDAFSIFASRWKFIDIIMKNSNATKTASTAFAYNAGANNNVYIRCYITDASNKFWKAFATSNSSAIFQECEVGNCANVGMDLSTGAYRQVINCWIHDCGSHGISIGDGVLLVYGSIIETNAGRGIATTSNGPFILIQSTIDGNTSDGFGNGALNSGMTVIGNIISNNGGYGFNFSAGAVDAEANGSITAFNDFYNNTSGAYSFTPLTYSFVNGQTLNPAFTNSAGSNYGIGTALRALGPTTRPIGGKDGPTSTSVDIGASQRTEPGGSGYLLVAP